jgi:Tfp pilus assembly protein PilO
MKKILRQYKIQILIFFSAIIIVSINFFIVNGEYQKLTALTLENQEKTSQLLNSQAKLDLLNQQAKQLDVINEKKAFVKKQLTTDIAATLFVSYLEKLSNSLNIIPLTVSVSGSPKKEKDSVLPTSNLFNLTFSSNFQTLVEFLRQIEKLDRLNTISTINLGKSEEILNISMSGLIFLEK